MKPDTLSLLLLVATLGACDEQRVLDADSRTPLLPVPMEFMRRAGLYETTSHVLYEEGCNGPGTPASDRTPYFRLTADEGVFGPVLSHEGCTTATDCTFTAKWAFLDDDGEGGFDGGTSSFAGRYPDVCSLGARTSRLVPVVGGVQLERKIFELEVPASGDQECTAAEAQRRQAELPCASYEVLVGRRVI